MDRLQAMRCFVRVVKRGSFSAAAEELGYANATVSKYVRQLEQWTQQRLLQRSTRSLQLTEAGQTFYDYCLRIEQETQALEDQLERDQVAGRLVVSAPISLTLKLLGPALLEFQQQHANLHLEMRLSDQAVDLVRDGIDLALRGSAELLDSSLIATSVMPLPRVLVASPAYLTKHGAPRHPEELSQHPCLVYSRGSEAATWVFNAGEQVHSVRVRGPLTVDNSLLLIQALLRDQGLGLVPRALVEDELASGALLALMSDWQPEGRSLHALYPNRQYLPRRVSALIEFLKQRFAGAQGAPNSAVQ